MKPTQIPEGVRLQLVDFQKFLQVLFVDHADISDRRAYKKLRLALKPFQQYSWFQEINSRIQRQNAVLAQTTQANRTVNKTSIDQIRQVNQQAFQAFQTGNLDSIRQAGSLLNQYMPAFERMLSREADIKNIVRNPVKRQQAMFGSGFTDALVPYFSDREAQKLIELDLDRFEFSPVPYPTDTADIDEVIFFMQNLRDSEDEIEVDGKSAVRLLQVSTSKEDMKKFNKSLESYLKNYNQEALQFVIDMVNSVPLLSDLNEKARREITGSEFYRGVGFDEDDEFYSEDDVVEHDLRRGRVAVSNYRHAALNFAHKRGHLEGGISRSERAYLLTYKPDTKDIVLVLEIFGSVYGESEIIIKPTVNNLTRIEDVTQSDYDWDEDDEYEDNW